jgi:NADPH-dependent glutamate synthase beta subunit-like oxidoreductase
MMIEGENLEGVWDGIDFLSRFHLENRPAVGHRVVVVGGGNTAIDAARSALRLGCEKVTLMYRRSRQEMPANDMEIEAAEDEGIEIMLLAAPSRILGKGGKVTQIEYIKMQLTEPDASGRRRPVPIPDSTSVMDADTVIAAIGQFSNMDFIHKGKKIADLKITKWNTIDGDEETLQTSIPYVFTGGDCFTGPSIAVEAIGEGRYAARSIHYFLTEGKIPPIEERQTQLIKETLFDQVEGLEKVPRVHPHELKVSTRVKNFEEVEHTISQHEARREAERCLRGGLMCYNRDIMEAMGKELETVSEKNQRNSSQGLEEECHGKRKKTKG